MGATHFKMRRLKKRRHRDGIACPRLQYDLRHEHHGHSGNDRSDEGVKGFRLPQKIHLKRQISHRRLPLAAQSLKTAEMTFPQENEHKRSLPQPG